MTSDLEKLILDSLDFNDQVKLSLEDLVFTPAAKKPKWIENPNADGAILLEEPQYDNSYFELLVRVVPAASTDAALKVVGEVMDKLQECELQVGGSAMTWTPNNSSRTYTAYVQMAEIAEIPITVTGDLAGWFRESPLLRIKLTCAPFLYGEQKVIQAAKESGAEPNQVIFVKVGGDVPAEGVLAATDKATQARRLLELGQDVVASSAGNPSLLLKAITDLTVTGFGGAEAEKAGSYSSKVVKASLSAVPFVMCSTGSIKHIGSYRIKIRGLAEASGVSFRMSYRTGGGVYTYRPWVQAPVNGEWCELDLSEASFEEVSKGEQISEVRIEGKSTSGVQIGYVDYAEFVQTYRYGLALAPFKSLTPTTFLARDDFSQAAGNLTGKVLLSGQTWTVLAGSDAVDFSVTILKFLGRNEKNDANINTGRYVTAGTTNYTDIGARVGVAFEDTSSGSGSPVAIAGVIVRCVDINNWLGAVIYDDGSGVLRAELRKRAGGTLSVVKSVVFTPGTYRGGVVQVEANSQGVWILSFSSLTSSLTSFTSMVEIERGYDSALATGGALATGKIGLVHANTAASGRGVFGDEFAAWVPSTNRVCESGRSVELRSNEVEKIDTTNKYWSRVPFYRGGYFFLDPEGDAGVYNRLNVKMRRLNTVQESSPNVTDKHAIEVLARERFLAPR